MLWLRRYGLDSELVWQTDWGEEFGGSNPEELAMLEEKYYQPLRSNLIRIPKGRKGYNGRVERSHCADDKEVYTPFWPVSRMNRISWKRQQAGNTSTTW